MSDNIGRTLSPLFRRLREAWDFQTEAEQKRRDMPTTISVAPNAIDDNASFHYLMLNVFKVGCMSHISARPDLAIPLSLMLVLKYSRGILQTADRKKALLISLSHPIEIAESLISYFLRSDVRPMLHGQIVEKDWPQLMRAACSVTDLGIDFRQEGAYFETDYMKSVIESSSWPYGLVVINDAIGELEPNYYVPVQQFNNIRSLTTELNLPVIIVNSHLQQYAFDAEVFDHIAQLREELDSYKLFIKKADRKAYGKLSFDMSPTGNILEDALTNDTTTKPVNYNSGSK